MTSNSDTTRRTLLYAAAGGMAALTFAPALVLADAKTVADEITRLFGERTKAEGRITLDLPEIAENGLVVPLSFNVSSPMTDSDYVKAVHLFADGNPSPFVAAFHFTPLSPKAAASIRLRLAKTQDIVAIAEMSTGELYTATRHVKVTIGGCGG